MSKKLLQINSTANIGSTGRLAEDLGQVAISNGWESYIAYGRNARESTSHLIKIGNKFSLMCHVLITRFFDKNGFGSYYATKTLLKEIECIDPDIIQIHNIHGYYLNIRVLFEYLSVKKIPVVWSLHDCWTMTGHCAHFALAKCLKWKDECNSCPLLRDYPKTWIVDNSKINYRRKKHLFTLLSNLNIISASLWLGKIVNQSYLSKYPVSIIPNGIDLEIYKPKNTNKKVRDRYGWRNKFVLIATGTSWGEQKGLYDYYKLRKVLSEEFVIVLVGMNEKQIKELPDGIVGLPRTSSPQDLAELYSTADVLMSLSYLEAFGLTPIEAFACGTPAIVYNCTSPPELITPDIGYIVEPGDICGIKEALFKMKEKGKAYFSENCRKRAEDMYNRYDRFKDYLNLYESILNNNN